MKREKEERMKSVFDTDVGHLHRWPEEDEPGSDESWTNGEENTTEDTSMSLEEAADPLDLYVEPERDESTERSKS